MNTPWSSAPTPMQLAAAGYSVDWGGATLVLRRGMDKHAARRAMREAIDALHVPAHRRLANGLLRVVARDLQVEVVTVAAPDPTAVRTQEAVKTGDRSPVSPEQVRRKVRHLKETCDLATLAKHPAVTYVREYPEAAGRDG